MKNLGLLPISLGVVERGEADIELDIAWSQPPLLDPPKTASAIGSG
jgi:hypothetical protein